MGAPDEPTRVINKYHGVPDGAVYIGRGSLFGNPFTHREGTKAQFIVGSREEAVRAYADWVPTQPQIMAAIPALKGKTLVCFCRPKDGFQGRLMCHGQILAALADGIDPLEVD